MTYWKYIYCHCPVIWKAVHLFLKAKYLLKWISSLSSALYKESKSTRIISPWAPVIQKMDSSNSSGMDPDLEGIIGERCSCLARSLLVGWGQGVWTPSQELTRNCYSHSLTLLCWHKILSSKCLCLLMFWTLLTALSIKTISPHPCYSKCLSFY